MTEHSSIPSIPADTSYTAKAVYSRDNFFLVVGDRLDQVLAGIESNGIHSARLPARRERPCLAMITIFQSIERLSDQQAVESTRTRVDWKYALHLSMNYQGLPEETLCAYRQHVLQYPQKLQALQLILDRLVESKLLLGNSGRSLEACAVLNEVCSITRLERVYKAMEIAIEALATHQPGWLREISLPHWYTRYSILTLSSRPPHSLVEREGLVESIGADISYLLDSIDRSPRQELTRLEEFKILRQVWREQFDPQRPTGVKPLSHCSYCGAFLPAGASGTA